MKLIFCSIFHICPISPHFSIYYPLLLPIYTTSRNPLINLNKIMRLVFFSLDNLESIWFFQYPLFWVAKTDDDRPNLAYLSKNGLLGPSSLNKSIYSDFWKNWLWVPAHSKSFKEMTLKVMAMLVVRIADEGQETRFGILVLVRSHWTWKRFFHCWKYDIYHKCLLKKFPDLFISLPKKTDPYRPIPYGPYVIWDTSNQTKNVPMNLARVLRLNIWSILYFHFFVIFDYCEKIKMFYKNTTDHVLLKVHRFYPFIEKCS